jgi:hypothetical protein
MKDMWFANREGNGTVYIRSEWAFGSQPLLKNESTNHTNARNHGRQSDHCILSTLTTSHDHIT